MHKMVFLLLIEYFEHLTQNGRCLQHYLTLLGSEMSREKKISMYSDIRAIKSDSISNFPITTLPFRSCPPSFLKFSREKNEAGGRGEMDHGAGTRAGQCSGLRVPSLPRHSRLGTAATASGAQERRTGKTGAVRFSSVPDGRARSPQAPTLCGPRAWLSTRRCSSSEKTL